MSPKDKPQTAESEAQAPVAANRNPAQPPQLTRAQLEAIRQKLQKKYH